MTPEQFCYWLQGYFELTNTQGLNHDQCNVISDHLKLVFDKRTPVRDLVSPDIINRLMSTNKTEYPKPNITC